MIEYLAFVGIGILTVASMTGGILGMFVLGKWLFKKMKGYWIALLGIVLLGILLGSWFYWIALTRESLLSA